MAQLGARGQSGALALALAVGLPVSLWAPAAAASDGLAPGPNAISGEAKVEVSRDLKRRDPRSDIESYAAFWARLDADRVGFTLWAGGTHAIHRFEVAYDIVVQQAYPGAVDPLQSAAYNALLGDDYRAPTARVELGVPISTGGLFLLPKLGIGYDAERERVAPLVPSLFAIIQAGPIYLELWQQLYLYSPFESGAQDSFYTRDALLFALGNTVAVGAQVEATVAVSNSAGDASRSSPFGVVTNVELGSWLTLGAFLGYEAQREARNSGSDWFSGRITVAGLWR